MATQAEINAALAAELAARPGTSRADLSAYAQSVYGLTPEQINTAYASLGGTTVSTPVTTVTTPVTTNTGLLTQGQNLSLTNQIKTYTDAEVQKALQDLSYLDPNASIRDIIGAAQAYGISRDRVIKNISAFTYNATNVNKLAKQILAQNTTAEWKGDVKPETAARYMADDLAKSGVTDISQVGRSFLGIINKETGEKLVSGYGERTKGNLWSGSYEGAGNTGFGVQFTESGAPIFYTEGASSSTLKKDLLKAAVIAGAAFGLAGPESLAGIFGEGAMLGQGLTASEAFAAGLTPAQAAAAGLSTAELAAAGYTTAQLAGTTGATGLLTGGAETLAKGALTASQIADLTKAGLTAAQIAGLTTTGAQTAAGLLQQQTSREAAQKAQAMIDAETAAAKTAAQFRPIGMTTRFGTSQFQVDPVTGQLTSAGYTLSPGALQAQDRLVALGNLGLAQAEGAQKAFEPLQTGAQRLFELGQGYLAKTPEQVASDYLKSQMALLQPSRDVELANIETRLRNQGRLGLSVAQGTNLGAASPELQALYNARAMQDAQLAAQAQQLGQRDVMFGAGLLGTGAQTMGQYYGGQQAAYAPFTTALGQVQGLETAAQQPLQLGAALGQTASTAGARMGQLGLEGARQSVALATGADATRNPYASALFGAASNPMFGQALGGLFGSQPATSGFSYGKYGTGVDPSTGEYFGSLYF